MLEQEDNIFVSKDAEEYEEYTRYLKQKHQIVEFMDVVKDISIENNKNMRISRNKKKHKKNYIRSNGLFFTDNGEETEDQRCKRRN